MKPIMFIILLLGGCTFYNLRNGTPSSFYLVNATLQRVELNGYSSADTAYYILDLATLAANPEIHVPLTADFHYRKGIKNKIRRILIYDESSKTVNHKFIQVNPEIAKRIHLQTQFSIPFLKTGMTIGYCNNVSQVGKDINEIRRDLKFYFKSRDGLVHFCRIIAYPKDAPLPKTMTVETATITIKGNVYNGVITGNILNKQ